MEAPQTPDGATPAFPNAARIYNYTLGGSFYYPPDQAAAEYMFSLVPSTKKWVHMLRDFLQAATQHIVKEKGITTFVDFASGLPTDEHIHAAAPGLRVIYSDNDPETYAAAQKLIGGLPNVRYFLHDVIDPLDLLEKPEVQEFLGDDRRVAIGISGVSSFLDMDDMQRMVADLYDWAAPGSVLYTTFETKEADKTTPRMEQFVDMFRQAGAPFHFYTYEESLTLCRPWSLPPSGLVPLQQFLGLPEGYITPEEHEDVGLEFYAAILEKPV
ncbi:hypothetical protein F8S13_17985 [Chloroflexia bacterium SDU3-3]|nr:hypothetical protein F8S13_17985 [Chloroflexia bacterium SDU3-3]